jgi:transcriptional regulator with XRE-family HTH domain
LQLSEGAARDIGTAFRFFRHARGDTLRDAAQRAGMSYQYVHNIESGRRPEVADEKFYSLARAYGVSEEAVANLLFKARITTLLEQRSVAPADIPRTWSGLVAVMATLGYTVEVDLSRVVATLLTSGGV